VSGGGAVRFPDFKYFNFQGVHEIRVVQQVGLCSDSVARGGLRLGFDGCYPFLEVCDDLVLGFKRGFEAFQVLLYCV
jgi:hypothetical protein